MSIQLLCTFLIVTLVFCYWIMSSLYILTLFLYILNINSSCCCLVGKSCPTLCNPVDSNSPGSSVQRILQARIPEASCHFPSPGNLSNANVELKSPASVARFFATEPPGKPNPL